ncbi:MULTISPECIES: sigma-54 interaction domain-containing protein [Bacillaceae]|uniref:sigma-54 interaction domain-containing protein n=1 Tax=Bacillaceae TaxID=186817 RepID=UPI000BFCB4DF|nr:MULTISPECIES: sigma 54-interacting transcriptional regulator [Bacillaceae]PGT81302.1 Fis family transcriptional regulator [Bacillus sp. AFS040349]UGB32897.1 sigma 54-interacting transcriptional regulator [Metabacillus sp. B2-18]
MLYENFKEFSLEDQLDWFKATLHSIHDGVLVIDCKEIVKLINPEYTRITGVQPNEIIGKPLRLVRPKAQLIETLKDGKERIGVYRKEGTVEYVVDMAPIILNNEIIGAVSICKGLTEVHKLSKELEKNKQKLSQLKERMDTLYQAKYTFDQIIGSESGLKRVVHLGRKAAESNLPVLIIGESGTGKELFAQAIHNASSRAEKPFIPVNCASIPASLIESELFGYTEGTFTSAKKGGKLGLFEIANSGTIFLDEIGELSYDLQAKLLRVLQEKTLRRVGEAGERLIDVRVIAATNRDLKQLIEKKRFREDLYFRLNVLHLDIPPLRKRKQDIPDIIDFILHKHNLHSESERYYRLHQSTLAILKAYDWIGNVRELKNTIDYAVCMADERDILPEHLPSSFHGEIISISKRNSNYLLKAAVEETEKNIITDVLQKHGSELEDKKKAAKELGVSLATLYNKMKKYQLYDF